MMFDQQCLNLCDNIIEKSAWVYKKVSSNPVFSPTTVKFHYQFNLREMSRVIEGLTCSAPAQYKGDINKFLKLWIHELKRVFSDRLTEMGDCDELDKILDEAFKGFEGAEKD